MPYLVHTALSVPLFTGLCPVNVHALMLSFGLVIYRSLHRPIQCTVNHSSLLWWCHLTLCDRTVVSSPSSSFLLLP
ncbi:hypothetical protein VN97_g10412 [Penicillium thymicola]|uniref:Uncharacterized protein n=1 Tax=Penicillium thymicola TaxID=293382 RepID=A0AAI9T953_PENTH|nr:hypothetical protein VN97_g10412 [Penicillium thymicola]